MLATQEFACRWFCHRLLAGIDAADIIDSLQTTAQHDRLLIDPAVTRMGDYRAKVELGRGVNVFVFPLFRFASFPGGVRFCFAVLSGSGPSLAFASPPAVLLAFVFGSGPPWRVPRGG